jgi:hypothetical protein
MCLNKLNKQVTTCLKNLRLFNQVLRALIGLLLLELITFKTRWLSCSKRGHFKVPMITFKSFSHLPLFIRLRLTNKISPKKKESIAKH